MTLPIIAFFMAVAAVLVAASLVLFRAWRRGKKKPEYEKKFVENLGDVAWAQEILNNLSTWGNEDLKARLIGKGVGRDAVLALERTMSRERFRAILIESNARYDTASLHQKKK